MLVWVSEEIRGQRAAIEALVRAGFDDLEGDDVEVRVEPPARPQLTFCGRAYAEPPLRWRTAERTRFVVRLFVPRRLIDRGYPKTYRYRGRRTAPSITVDDWRERVLTLAAHEACHIRQFRDGARRSEIQAERRALAALEAYRNRTVWPVGQLSLFDVA